MEWAYPFRGVYHVETNANQPHNMKQIVVALFYFVMKELIEQWSFGARK